MLLASANPDETLFSDFTTFLMPAPSPPIPVPSTALEIALQVIMNFITKKLKSNFNWLLSFKTRKL